MDQSISTVTKALDAFKRNPEPESFSTLESAFGMLKREFLKSRGALQVAVIQLDSFLDRASVTKDIKVLYPNTEFEQYDDVASIPSTTTQAIVVVKAEGRLQIALGLEESVQLLQKRNISVAVVMVYLQITPANAPSTIYGVPLIPLISKPAFGPRTSNILHPEVININKRTVQRQRQNVPFLASNVCSMCKTESRTKCADCDTVLCGDACYFKHKCD